jgi:dienelactone hydrolase
MGGKDTETPPSECIPRLQALESRGAPVEWKVFDDATHGWDKPESNNVRRTPPWAGGRTVVYQFNKSIREQSAGSAFDFVQRQFGSS